VATFGRAHHIALTVRDMDLSAEWYQRVLGFRLVRKFDEGIPRTVLQHPASGLHVGLYNHANRSGDSFSPLRTGLDHFALQVDEEAQLDEWVAELDGLGVAHSPIRDIGHARFVSFEDPDGIQIEFWLAVIPHRPADNG